jgi:acyl-CoA synthetase (AMP-forming)/AMP-acid ligase II
MSPPSVLLEASSTPNDTFSWSNSHTRPQYISTSDPQTKQIEPRQPFTIDELIRLRAHEDPNDLILSYPSSGIEYVDYTFRQLDVFASRVAREYIAVIPQRRSSSDLEVVVGLLGPSTFEYFITILALAKLGHTVLFLSTRISTAAYISLFQATGAQHLLIDPSFRDTARNIQDAGLQPLKVHELVDKTRYDFPILESGSEIDTRFDQNFSNYMESGKIAWIIHSSGSTGLPKPIFQTNNAALTNYASNFNLRGFITLPLYHAHGISSVFRSIHSRKHIYLYNSNLPLTQQTLLSIIKRYDFQILYGVPYALKMLGESAEGIDALAKLKVVMFGGSACPDALGKRLVDHGVNLISHYGTYVRCKLVLELG